MKNTTTESRSGGKARSPKNGNGKKKENGSQVTGSRPVAGVKGPPSNAGVIHTQLRPEGEAVSEHAGTSGEVSTETLANPDGTQSRQSTIAPVTGLEPVTIIRATMRLPIDLADLLQGDERQAHFDRTCPGLEGCKICMTRKDLRETRRSVVRCMNAAMRLHWRCDADVLDRCMLEHGRAPKGDEWKQYGSLLGAIGSALPGSGSEREVLAKAIVNSKGNLYTYPLLRRLEPTLGSNLCATIQNQVQKKWLQMRWGALVMQDVSPPHFKATDPISIPAQSARVIKRGQLYYLIFSLHTRQPGNQGHEYELPVRPRDEKMEAILAYIVADKARMGQIQIEEDRLRPGRWFARIAYKRQIVQKVSTVTAGVNRGICAFIAAVTSEDERWIYDGDDIVAYLKAVQERRRRIQYQLKASNRGGHGKNRTLQPIEVLTGKAERWRATKCQTIARRLANWLNERNVSTVYIEDFTGIRDGLPEKLEGGERVWQMIQEWPYYQLQTRFVSCLEENGITTEIVSPQNISRHCPNCGHTDKANMELRFRRFNCKACGWKRHLDVAAALNVMERGKRGESEEGNVERKKARKATKANKGKG